jgi:hypothetical protein
MTGTLTDVLVVAAAGVNTPMEQKSPPDRLI